MARHRRALLAVALLAPLLALVTVGAAAPTVAADTPSTLRSWLLPGGSRLDVTVDAIPEGTSADDVTISGTVSLTAQPALGAVVVVGTPATLGTEGFAILAELPPTQPVGVVAIGAAATTLDVSSAPGTQVLVPAGTDADGDGRRDARSAVSALRASPPAAGNDWGAALDAAAAVAAQRLGGAARVIFLPEAGAAYNPTAATRAAYAGLQLFGRNVAAVCSLGLRNLAADGASDPCLPAASRFLGSTTSRLVKSTTGWGADDFFFADGTTTGSTLPAVAPAGVTVTTGRIVVDAATRIVCVYGIVRLPWAADDVQRAHCPPVAVQPSFDATPNPWAYRTLAYHQVDDTGRFTVEPYLYAPSGHQGLTSPTVVVDNLTGTRTAIPLEAAYHQGGLWTSIDRSGMVAVAGTAAAVRVHDRTTATDRTIPLPPRSDGRSVGAVDGLLSGDGRTVVVADDAGDGAAPVRLVLLDVATGAATVVPGADLSRSFDLSVDGQRLVVARRDRGGLWLYERGTGTVRDLVGAAEVSQPSITGDGRAVAFVTTSALLPADADATADLYVLDVASGVPALLDGAGPAGGLTRQAISDDGRRVGLSRGGRGVVHDRASGVELSVGVAPAICVPVTVPGAASVSATGTRAWYDAAGARTIVDLPVRPETPGIDPGPAIVLDEGQAFHRDLEICRAEGAQVSVEPGAGVPGYGGLVNGGSFPLDLGFADDTSHLVRIDATTIGTATALVPVTVRNVAPEVDDAWTTQPDGTDVGTTVVLDGSFHDDGVLDTHTALVGWGDGTSSPATITPGAEPGRWTFTASHTYGQVGTSSVTVTVTDDDGGAGSYATPVTTTAPAAVAPVVEAGGPVTTTEGGVLTYVAGWNDPDSTSWTATFDQGDGELMQLAVPSGARQVLVTARYLLEGTYTGTLRIADAEGNVGADTVTVTVVNGAPAVDAVTVQGSGGRAPATVQLRATVTDPGLRDTHTAVVDWGDGTTSRATRQADRSFTATHVYDLEGTYTATVTATDDGGATGAASSVPIEVAPPLAAPLVDAGPATSLVEGGSVTLPVAATDPDDAGISRITVDWGDGAAVEDVAFTAEGAIVPPSHAYRSDGVFTATVEALDVDDQSGTATVEVTVTNGAPVVGPLSTSGAPTVGFSAPVSDAGPDDVLTATLDPGDGTPPLVATIAGGVVTASHTYAPGSYTATLAVEDGVDRTAVTTPVQVVAPNQAPTVELGPAATLVEGTALVRAGRIVDAGDGGPWTATGAVDGGTPAAVGVAADGTFTVEALFTDEGNHTITIEVTDGGGLTGSATLAVTVTNAPPTLGALSAPSGPVLVGQEVEVRAPVTDPGSDVLSAVLDWGDGTSSAASVVAGQLSATHRYATTGGFRITVTVADGDGGTTSATHDLLVVDAGGGRLLGAGHIGTSSGSAFVGAAVHGDKGKAPSGVVAYALKDGLLLRSTTIAKLVVQGGQATVTGTGTVGRQAGYGFELVVVDGRPDKAGMRIWETATGRVVHDSGGSRPLQRGAFQVR